MATSKHPGNDLLLNKANKTITNLRDENRRLSDELKEKTALLSACIDVAHDQSLRISSLSAALQDTLHWDPSTCPRPSLCSTPRTKVVCGGKRVSVGGKEASVGVLPPLRLKLSNRYETLSDPGATADTGPSSLQDDDVSAAPHLDGSGREPTGPVAASPPGCLHGPPPSPGPGARRRCSLVSTGWRPLYDSWPGRPGRGARQYGFLYTGCFYGSTLP
ncbi:unnamed protein product [Merluccius merluccius]